MSIKIFSCIKTFRGIINLLPPSLDLPYLHPKVGTRNTNVSKSGIFKEQHSIWTIILVGAITRTWSQWNKTV